MTSSTLLIQALLKKKSDDFCPICFSELEVVDVAPCFDCGNTKEEILHFKEGKHTYGLFRIFNKDIVLCNFCMVDFSSYDASFFGLKKILELA